MNDALGYAAFGIWLVGLFVFARAGERHPSAFPDIGSSQAVFIVNATDESLRALVRAPDVDRAERAIGRVPPRDSIVLRLPYAEAAMTLALVSDSARPVFVELPRRDCAMAYRVDVLARAVSPGRCAHFRFPDSTRERTVVYE